MAPFRKALGVVKDQTSIGLAKVSSNIAPDLDVAIVKATSHDDDPADDKYVREILNLTSYSRGYISACVAAISKRLSKTHDWVVALKALMLVHRLLADGDLAFQQEILYATRRGTRLLNMSDFRDEAHSNSWDHSAFVRTYAMYLDQRLECMVYERKQTGSSSSDGNGAPNQWRSPPQHRSDYGGELDHYGSNSSGNYGRQSYSSPPSNHDSYDDRQKGPQGNERKPPTPLRDMKPERVLSRMNQLQRLLDRFLACRPTGLAKNCRLVLIALYPVVRESFQIYADICEVLAVLLDRFFDMEYPDCVKSFDAYASAAKQIDELAAFYGWCKDTGVARSSEYPEVQRITDKLLETLEEFTRDRSKRPKSPERPRIENTETVVVDEEPVEDMNSIKALPAPPVREVDPLAQEKVESVVQEPTKQQHEGELVNLRDDTVSADEQGNRFALALFTADAGGRANGGKGNWEPFSEGDANLTSAWETPAAESGKADWELALVETASNLAKQKPSLAGGFDPLLLNGMYDHGSVQQHVNAQKSSGSASSVVLPAPGGGAAARVLALPAPDGSTQSVIGGDPFSASLSVPPPAYVQMADMEKKQQLLTQEQILWQSYSIDGMRGQVSLDKLQVGYGYPGHPYGMPQPPPSSVQGAVPFNGVGYYYPSSSSY